MARLERQRLNMDNRKVNGKGSTVNGAGLSVNVAPIGAGAFAAAWLALPEARRPTEEIVHVQGGDPALLRLAYPPKRAFLSRCGNTDQVTVPERIAADERWASTIAGLAVCTECARKRR